MVGTTGVEPARITPQDPKSCASANSATRPRLPLDTPSLHSTPCSFGQTALVRPERNRYLEHLNRQANSASTRRRKLLLVVAEKTFDPHVTSSLTVVAAFGIMLRPAEKRRWFTQFWHHLFIGPM